MINTVKLHISSQELPSNTTIDEIKSILYSGVCINERTLYSSGYHSRVFFAYDGGLHVRAIENTLAYIQCLPSKLRDSSELDDIHLKGVVRKLGNNEITLTVLCKIDGTLIEDTTPKGLSILKDFT